MFAELPPELHSSIISNVYHKNDLSSLALTCHALREDAQRELFSNPVVQIYPAWHRYQVPFLDSVTSSPDRLALMVRKITIRMHVSRELSSLRVRAQRHGQNVDGERQELVGWIEEIGEKLKTALQLMHGTTHLQFYFDANNLQSHPTWFTSFLETCTFRLKVLVWEVGNTDLQLLLTKNLKHQQELRVLKLHGVRQFDDGSATDSLLSHFCPHLHTISAPWPVICAMLQHNRGIPCLEWRVNSSVFGTSSTSVEQKFPRVKYLWGPNSFKYSEVPLTSFINIVLLQIGFLLEEDYTPIASLQKLEVLIVMYSQNSNMAPMSRQLLTHSTNLAKVFYHLIVELGVSDPAYACHTYEPAENEIQIRFVDENEMNTWRGLAELEFADIEHGNMGAVVTVDSNFM